MDAPAPEPRIDARAARFELVAMAVVLIGGFVFSIIGVIPGLALVLAVGLGLGPRANLFSQLFQALVAGRLKRSAATEPESLVRFSELFAVVVLSVATLFYLAGLPEWLVWLVALIEAGVCALHATTGLSLELAVRERLPGRGRRKG